MSAAFVDVFCPFSPCVVFFLKRKPVRRKHKTYLRGQCYSNREKLRVCRLEHESFLLVRDVPGALLGFIGCRWVDGGDLLQYEQDMAMGSELKGCKRLDVVVGSFIWLILLTQPKLRREEEGDCTVSRTGPISSWSQGFVPVRTGLHCVICLTF